MCSAEPEDVEKVLTGTSINIPNTDSFSQNNPMSPKTMNSATTTNTISNSSKKEDNSYNSLIETAFSFEWGNCDYPIPSSYTSFYKSYMLNNPSP
jgi:hypothetical protein